MAQNALNNPEAYKSFDVFDSASPSIPPAHTPTPVKERPQNTSNTNDRESEKSPKKVKNGLLFPLHLQFILLVGDIFYLTI
jgi:hypothetical protein